MSTPPDPGAVATVAPVTGPADKVRIRFFKGGPLRWLSHHDLMRAFERLLRRSAIPFRRTQGFNPHPRLIFALSLPLGVIGHAEVAELELDQPIPPEELLDRLRIQCPPGLELLSLERIPPRSSAQVSGLCYGIELPADRVEKTNAKIAELLASSECWIDRRRPSGGANSRRMNLRPVLRDLRIEGDPPWLSMHLWLTQAGTARPDEVLKQLDLEDLIEAGTILHRLSLALKEEG